MSKEDVPNKLALPQNNTQKIVVFRMEIFGGPPGLATFCNYYALRIVVCVWDRAESPEVKVVSV